MPVDLRARMPVGDHRLNAEQFGQARKAKAGLRHLEKSMAPYVRLRAFGLLDIHFRLGAIFGRRLHGPSILLGIGKYPAPLQCRHK